MHSVQDEGHREKVAVLERNHLPHVFVSGSVCVDLSQEAERIDNDPHPNPACNGQKIADVSYPFPVEFGLDIQPWKSHEDVTGIVDDQDHGSCYNLVAHRWEEDQWDCHGVVEDVFVEFPFCFSFQHHHFEEWEEVDSQLDHKVHLEFLGWVDWPAGILLVDLGTWAAPSRHAGEPVLIIKECVGQNGHEGVEDGVEW